MVERDGKFIGLVGGKRGIRSRKSGKIFLGGMRILRKGGERLERRDWLEQEDFWGFGFSWLQKSRKCVIIIAQR